MQNVPIGEMLAFLKEQEIDFDFFGDPDGSVDGFSNLEDLDPGKMVWIKSERYFD